MIIRGLNGMSAQFVINFMNLSFIRESMVLKDKDIIRDVNGFYLALIMNYLWRIDLYVMAISNGRLYSSSSFLSVILRV